MNKIMFSIALLALALMPCLSASSIYFISDEDALAAHLYTNVANGVFRGNYVPPAEYAISGFCPFIMSSNAGVYLYVEHYTPNVVQENECSVGRVNGVCPV